MENINNISTLPPDTITKLEVKEELKELYEKLFSLQHLFYAEDKHALLIVLQGMDASGKDGVIRHVFSHVNPQGCNVRSFKSPTEIEKAHDFLWRINASLPKRGMFQIFNRSHYEDIIFPAVHKELNKNQVEQRITVMNQFEEHLQNNNTIILKFYLHISENEQDEKLAERLTDPTKKWKYDKQDKKEAKKWADYMNIYQKIFDGSKKNNPWIIVPSDKKWYRNYIVAKTIVKTLEDLKMKYPQKI